jgi:predicted Zn-dependent protease
MPAMATPPFALSRRRCCLGLLTTLAGLAAKGCATGGALVSAEKERELGREAAEEVERETGLVRDPALVGYVSEVGRRLAAHSPRQDVPYVFQVADDPEPNAFALPGGYVYVTRGILAILNSEAELAGVMGHEIAHVVARHAVRRATAASPFALVFGLPAAILGTVTPGLGGIVGGAGKLAGGLVLAPFSRDQEREADQLGMQYAAAAGWDPHGLTASLHALERETRLAGHDPARISFFSSHPATPERVATTEQTARGLTRGAGAPIAGTRAAFLARLDGLVVGPAAAHGVFVDRQFLHPELGFAWQVPDGWKTRNTPEAVGASEADRRALVVLGVSGKGTDPVAGARADGLDERMIGRLTRSRISGLPAARLIADSRDARVDLTWIALAGTVYRIAGVSAIRDFERYRPVFARTAESFRPLAAAERDRIMEARLRVRPGRAGETVRQFVERNGGAWSPEHTAVANGVEVDTRLEANWPVKVPFREKFRAS